MPPLLDGSSANKNLYVTNTQGDVFEVQTAGTCAGGPPCLVASDTSTVDKGSGLGVNDAPLFDVSASKLYVFADIGTSTNQPVVVKFASNLSSPVTVNVGPAGGNGARRTYSGAFDHTFLTGNGTTGNLNVCSLDILGDTELFQVPITSGGFGTVSAPIDLAGRHVQACSPITENFAGSTDRVFFGVNGNCFSGSLSAAGGCVMSFNLPGRARRSHMLRANSRSCTRRSRSPGAGNRHQHAAVDLAGRYASGARARRFITGKRGNSAFHPGWASICPPPGPPTRAGHSSGTGHARRRAE
jgi:hypothetical protein